MKGRREAPQRVPVPVVAAGDSAGVGREHALDLRTEPPTKHVARVVEGETDDSDYRCAYLLAEIVGIDLVATSVSGSRGYSVQV